MRRALEAVGTLTATGSWGCVPPSSFRLPHLSGAGEESGRARPRAERAQSVPEPPSSRAPDRSCGFPEGLCRVLRSRGMFCGLPAPQLCFLALPTATGSCPRFCTVARAPCGQRVSVTVSGNGPSRSSVLPAVFQVFDRDAQPVVALGTVEVSGTVRQVLWRGPEPLGGPVDLREGPRSAGAAFPIGLSCLAHLPRSSACPTFLEEEARSRFSHRLFVWVLPLGVSH